MKKVFAEIIPILLILMTVVLFFSRLFFPEPRIFYNVEVIGSDIWNVYYPLRDFLSDSIKKGEMPFWSKDIGMGFPVFGEGQVGVLFLPNLILYYLFETWMAWNLSFVLAFFLLFSGSYLFFRRLGISTSGSFFSGLVFSFGGYFVARVIHIAPLLTASLFPWILLTGDRLYKKPSFASLLLFSLVVSQQIFSGHLQWVMISWLGLLLWIGVQVLFNNTSNKRKQIFWLASGVIFGVLMSAPQLFQTYELRSESVRSEGLSQEEVFVFPYELKHLYLFVNPEQFGSPRNGTLTREFGQGLYWENVAYMGIVPLVLAGLSLFFRKKRLWEWSFIFIGVFSLLLVLGKLTPLSFLMTLPILNNFRISSRFLLLVTFSLAVLAGSGFDRVKILVTRLKGFKYAHYLISMLLIALAVGEVFSFWNKYLTTVSVKDALSLPKVVNDVEEGARVWADFSYLDPWKRAYSIDGWERPEPFLFLRNSLYGNLSYVFGRTNVRPLAGLWTKRQQLYGDLMDKLLDVSSVEYITSVTELENEDGLKKISSITSEIEGLPPILVYENTDKLERVRFVSKYQVFSSIEDVADVIEQEEYSLSDNVLLEKDIGVQLSPVGKSFIEVVEDGDLSLVIETKSDQEAILVVADAYFPAWEAYVDGELVETLAANINQRAVLVPSGEHKVEMKYNPKWFYRGVVVSLSSLLLFFISWFILAVIFKKSV